MELKFINIDSSASKPKGTVHVTGKLGFNMEAAKFMGFNDSTYYRFAVDDESVNVSNLYLVSATADDEGSVKVSKAGQYYYINLANAFRHLGLDYEKYIISFDIDKSQYEGNAMFILTRRKKKEKLRESSDKPSGEESDQ